MRPDDYLADLPEAVPLHRVSPVWRVLAVVEAIAGAGLLLLLLMTLTALLKQRSTPPAPAVPVVPPVVSQSIAPEKDDEASVAPHTLPYPIEEDLRLAHKGMGARPPVSARDRFVQRGQEDWKPSDPWSGSDVVVSPDGQSLAYLAGEQLFAGPIGNAEVVSRSARAGGSTAAPRIGPAGLPGPAVQARLRGPLSWSADGSLIYLSDTGGRLQCCHVAARCLEALPFFGDSPAPLPTEPTKVVFVRYHSVGKTGHRDAPATPDPSEVVLADVTTQEVKVLVPRSPASWSHLAVSPDGTRLALVGDRDATCKPLTQVRIFILDFESQKLAPLTPPVRAVGSVCWAPDGKSLIYTRSQEPLPPDWWEEEAPGLPLGYDLFQCDLATGKETRLTRGGGFDSPSISQDGQLFYLARKREQSRGTVRLRHLPLAEARSFAAREPEPVPRSAEAWAELARGVWKECGVSGDEDPFPTAVQLARLADGFARHYRQRFRQEPPDSLKALDRQRQELSALDLPPDMRPYLDLVLGAVEGEYLVRNHGARWHLTKKGLSLAGKPSFPVAAQSPFSYVLLAFSPPTAAAVTGTSTDADGLDRAERMALSELVGAAQGRPLVLVNDPAETQAAVEVLVDTDLARGLRLLETNQGDEADRVLLALVDKKQHRANYHLALHVGRLLYEHNRLAALRQLMERQCGLKPLDAGKFNLLGLALVREDPRRAIDQFQRALRCDLRFGPAYLNLALAYQAIDEPRSARQCLRRYLKLEPAGVCARDARRRLQELEAEEPN